MYFIIKQHLRCIFHTYFKVLASDYKQNKKNMYMYSSHVYIYVVFSSIKMFRLGNQTKHGKAYMCI